MACFLECPKGCCPRVAAAVLVLQIKAATVIGMSNPPHDRPPSQQPPHPYTYHRDDDQLRLPPLNLQPPNGAGYYHRPGAPPAAGQQTWAPPDHSFPMPATSQHMPHIAGPAGQFTYEAHSMQHGNVHDPTRHGPHAPMSDAFRGNSFSEFPLRPVDTRAPENAQPSSSRVRLDDIPIDPRLIPLPELDGDKDLHDSATIAEATGHPATEKLAGSRRKGKQRAEEPGSERRADKGKRRAEPLPAPSRKRVRLDDDVDDEHKSTKRGRPYGAGNYSQDDLAAMLSYVEDELPLGQRGWERIHRRFVLWARRHGRPERALKSLETKYKQLVKAKKPTGDGVCPPSIERAHAIEDLINDRAGTRDLADSDFDDVVNGDAQLPSDNAGGSSDDDAPAPASLRLASRQVVDATVIRAPTAPHRPADTTSAPAAPSRRRANVAADLVSRVAQVFDPDIQQARDSARHSRSLEHTQFFSLHQQLRDSLSVNETYRNEIADLRDRLHAAESARDRAEMRLEILQATADHHGRSRERNGYRRTSPHFSHHSTSCRPHRSTSRRSRRFYGGRSQSPRIYQSASAPRNLSPSALDTPTRRRLYKATGRQEYKTRRPHIVNYPGGGQWTTWITDESADEDGNPIAGPSDLDLWPPSPLPPIASPPVPAPAQADDAALDDNGDGDNPISDWEMTPPPPDGP